MSKRGVSRRYLKPAAAAVGVPVAGWHVFRHELSRTLRRAGVHPVAIKDTLGHSKVDLAMNAYDKTSAEDIRASLRVASKSYYAAFCYQTICYQQLRRSLGQARVRLKSFGCNEKLVSAEGIEPSTY